jgi:hypothetical protein
MAFRQVLADIAAAGASFTETHSAIGRDGRLFFHPAPAEADSPVVDVEPFIGKADVRCSTNSGDISIESSCVERADASCETVESITTVLERPNQPKKKRSSP